MVGDAVNYRMAGEIKRPVGRFRQKARMAVAGRDPRLFASAEQGQKAVEFQLERMAKLLREALDTVE